jgi:hypothetical protein
MTNSKDHPQHRRLVELWEDFDLWAHASNKERLQVIFNYSLLYGRTQDTQMIGKLGFLYSNMSIITSEEERLDLLMGVTKAIEANHSSILSFYPFIFVESETSIISTASLNLACLHPLVDDDPMTGPKEVLKLAKMTNEENCRTGILTGLILLGDRRVNPIAKGCWKLLKESASREALARAWSGYVHAGTIEFLLDWLEAEAVIVDSENFGAVAGALQAIPMKEAIERKVRDVERKFPVNAPDDRPVIRLLAEWSYKEYAEKILPRLKKIAAIEAEPRVLATAMSTWGVSL